MELRVVAFLVCGACGRISFDAAPVSGGDGGPPRDGLAPDTIDGAPGTQMSIVLTGTAMWQVPADWNNAANHVECIGAGGGTKGAGTAGGGPGGGGGAYARVDNISLTPTSFINYSTGIGGVNGANGTDSWFYLQTTILAAAGHGASTDHGGGLADASMGSVKFSGGKGGAAGTGGTGAGGGGGGAAGPGGDGGAGGAGNAAGGGGGGGGNGGGAPGADGAMSGGNGGDNANGTGRGTAVPFDDGNPGTLGGGGAGGAEAADGAAGGPGTDLPAGIGGGGGGGGAGGTGDAGASAIYGSGGGGTAANGGAGVKGGDGVCVVTYTP